MRSIRNYLIVALTSVLVSVFALAIIISYYESRHEVDELFDAELVQATRLLEASMRIANVTENLSDSEKAHEQFDQQVSEGDERTQFGHRYERKVTFQIRRNHEVLFESERSDLKLTERPPLGFSELRSDGYLWYLFTLQVGDLYYTTGERVDVRQEITQEIVMSYLLPLLCILPVSVFLIIWISRRGLKPILVLDAKIRQRGKDNLTNIDMKGVPREIESVIGSLNHLFARVQQSIEHERRFVAIASHEMRTPISVLKINIQNALKASDEQERLTHLEDLDKGIDRTSQLMEQLLTLNKLEQQQTGYELSAIDLLPVIRTSIADLYPLVDDKNLQIGLDSDEDYLPVLAIPQLLPLLLNNLIENAIKYTPTGGEVHVGVYHAGSKVTVCIEDSGPGVAESELTNILGPFYRLPNPGVQGTGLGLAIVKRTADLSQLKLILGRSEKFGGLSIRVEFQTA